MNVLTQTIENLKNQELFELLNTKCAEYITPLTSSLSVANYGEFMSSLSDMMQFYGREILKNTFESMDLAFRNSPSRVSKYYVKQTRNRTIISVFGEVTFRRTEYINRATKASYCYVDRKLKLRSRERYDCAVQTLIV